MTNRQPPVDTVGGACPHEARPSPTEFLRIVEHPVPQWSEPFGGPDGVIALTGALLDDLAAQAQRIAAVRTAAMREQLRTESGAAIARRHHITKQAVHKAAAAKRPWNEGGIW